MGGSGFRHPKGLAGGQRGPPKSPPQDLDSDGHHLPSVLEISEVGDSAIYLLNPQTVAADGEWQAWFFSSWNPGAVRHRSFEELMVAQRDSYRYVRDPIAAEKPRRFAGARNQSI